MSIKYNFSFISGTGINTLSKVSSSILESPTDRPVRRYTIGRLTKLRNENIITDNFYLRGDRKFQIWHRKFEKEK